MVKISVIVPVYNSEKFLEKCLNSLINQEFQDIEFICVNDGSKDRSLEILNTYAKKDKRLKIIDLANSGPSIARNKGLEIAQGEYIGFVDSDDWLDFDFFKKLYTSAKKYDADIAASGIKRHKSCKWKYYIKFKKEKFTDDTIEKFKLCDVPDKCYVWNKIYKASELKKHNITFEPNTYFEDRCFTAEALIYLKRLVTVPDIYYHYRVNYNSIVKTKSLKKSEDSKYTKENMQKIMLQNGVNIRHEVKKFKVLGLTVCKVKYYGNKKELILLNQLKLKLK